MTLRSHPWVPFTYLGSLKVWSLGIERGKRSPVGPCLTFYIYFPSVTLVGEKIALQFGMVKRSAYNSVSLPIHAKNPWEGFQSIICVFAQNILTLQLPTVITWDALVSVPQKQILLVPSLLKYNPSPPHPRSGWPSILMRVIINKTQTTSLKIP